MKRSLPVSRASGPAHSVRIIGGRLRGSKLEIAAVPGLRPTSDRARETLFNWLMPVIDGARVLDLYAGTGALGIEALSRGAASACFVEANPAVATALRASLVRLKLSAEVVQARALDALAPGLGTFDLVFIDPPFADLAWDAACAKLAAAGVLSPSAWIHVESPMAVEPMVPGDWMLWRQGRFGEVMLRLYRRGHGSPIS